ncbi:HU family DNA-binding protein [Propionivibrio sp.]|uniref:HU family DNA-binding protein n=1 Tax=Propionivibrio sp. TaxID=2212460 RepID=UPI003BF4239A
MNQAELVATIASITGETQKTVEHVLKTTADVIGVELHEGGEATLPGIGKLVANAKAARTGRNPKTGEAITIAARTVPVFRAAKALKDAVNG